MTDRRLAGRYRIEALLGRGGMGSVWRAHDEFLGRTVAVKEVSLPAAGASDADHAELCERTVREARAAAALTHPSIITVHDVLTEDQRPWIVMDLIRGRSLEEIRTTDGPMPPQRVAQLGLQLLDALAVAHRHGVIHRDVKPHNVLITDGGRAVLTDFGIATIAGDQRLTGVQGVIGSPGYIAPERLVGGDDAGPSCDLWSLGATLYAAVEGVPPFNFGDPLAMLGAALTQPPPPPRLAGPLGPILLGLLEKDPGARPHPEHLRRTFQAIAAGAPVPPPAIPHPDAPTHPAGYPSPADAATRPAQLPPGIGPFHAPHVAAAPAPAAAAGGRRRPYLIAAALLALVVPTTAVGGYLLLRGDGGKNPVSTVAGPDPTVTSTSAGTSAGRASASRPASAAAAVDPCSLLTATQARQLVGDIAGRATGTGGCSWLGLTITVKSYPETASRSGITAAKEAFGLQLRQAQSRAGENTSDPVTQVTRSAPAPVSGAGDESFVQDETFRGMFAGTSSQGVFRSGAVILTVKADDSVDVLGEGALHARVSTAGRWAVENLPRG